MGQVRRRRAEYRRTSWRRGVGLGKGVKSQASRWPPVLATGLGIPALIGGWLIDRRNRLRGELIAAVAMLPRTVVSESWRRDHSSDEEFDQKVKTGSQQLLSVLKEGAEQKYQNGLNRPHLRPACG